MKTDDTFELYSQGIRLLNNPEFNEIETAVNTAEKLLTKIKQEYYGIVEQKEIEVEITEPEGWSELINAMNADSDLVAIEKIIKSNPNSVFETDIEEGYTALHYAAWDNKFDIVKLLIKSGAEIDPIGEDGLSPFLLAANNGFYEIVEILADNGADINRISQDAEDPYQGVSGTSAIRTASLNQYWDVVSFLMNRDVKLEILLEPCLGNPNGLTDFFEVMRAVGISNENILKQTNKGRLMPIWPL